MSERAIVSSGAEKRGANERLAFPRSGIKRSDGTSERCFRKNFLKESVADELSPRRFGLGEKICKERSDGIAKGRENCGGVRRKAGKPTERSGASTAKLTGERRGERT